MPTFTTNEFGVVCILENQEAEDWSNGVLATGGGSTHLIPLCVLANIAAPVCAAVVGAFGLFCGAYGGLMKLVNKGNGLYMTIPWPAIPLMQWWLIVPTTRPPGGPGFDGIWSKQDSGVLGTEDPVDIINFSIERGAVDPTRLQFRLVIDPASSGWGKRLEVPDGANDTKSTGDFSGDGESRTVDVSSDLISSGRPLKFWKAKFMGIMTQVLGIGDTEGLMPGDRVTFRWKKDQ